MGSQGKQWQRADHSTEYANGNQRCEHWNCSMCLCPLVIQSFNKKKPLHWLYQQLRVIPHSAYDDTLQASESLNFNSTLTMLIAQENISEQLNYLFNAVLSKQWTIFSMPDYSCSQVLFNKLLHSMKIIQARKISTIVEKQIKRLTLEE